MQIVSRADMDHGHQWHFQKEEEAAATGGFTIEDILRPDFPRRTTTRCRRRSADHRQKFGVEHILKSSDEKTEINNVRTPTKESTNLSQGRDMQGLSTSLTKLDNSGSSKLKNI